VAVPLEEAINGVEGLMYMKSVAASDGSLQVVATFRPEIDPDTAAVRVQNRVSQAQSRLPEEVRQFGVTTQKQASTPLMYVGLVSPGRRMMRCTCATMSRSRSRMCWRAFPAWATWASTARATMRCASGWTRTRWRHASSRPAR
jgi:multidrug efflux pump subunit AcrB